MELEEILNEAPLVPVEAHPTTPNGAQIPGDAHPPVSTPNTSPLGATVSVNVEGSSGTSGEVVQPTTPRAVTANSTPNSGTTRMYPRRHHHHPDWYHDKYH